MASGNGRIIEIASPLGPMRLRPEREDDQAFRLALFRYSRAAEFTALPLEPAALEQLMRVQFAAQTSGYRAAFPNARYDIIELEHRSVGRIVVDHGDEYLHIVDQAILPSLRNRGLGSTIMRALMQEAADAGKVIVLMVATANRDAVRLYVRLGFVPIVDEPLHLTMHWRAPGS